MLATVSPPSLAADPAPAPNESDDNDVEDGFTESAPRPDPEAQPEEPSPVPVDARLSRRHIAFGIGGGPIFFGSILGEAHYIGSNVGGLVNLGFGEHVDARGAVMAAPSASARGLHLPVGGELVFRFGHTAHPISAGVGFAFGYLFTPAPPPESDRWSPISGAFMRPELIPLAIQLQRFELELYAGVDFVDQRQADKTRFAAGFVSGGLRFFFVGYDTDAIVRQ